MTLQQLLTLKEVAGYFRIDVRTLYRWINQGLVKTIRINHTQRITEKEFNRLCENGEAKKEEGA